MTGAAAEKRQYRMKVRARRSEATADRVKRAALELFRERPYDEVTLAGIAETAGVTVPTVIAHCGRKEDLFAATCEAEIARIVEQRDEAPVGDHAGAVRNLLDHYEADGAQILHSLAEENRVPAVRAATDVGRRYHREWVERVFEPSLRPLRARRRAELAVQLIVATDLLTWKLMRLDMKLSRSKTEATIVQMLDALAGQD